jgi:16S rRNA (cytosine1402-N4)-methyltransferase
MSLSIHTAVLVEESMLALNLRPGGVYMDGTLGGATHTEELLKRTAPGGRVVSLDIDPLALARARTRLEPYGDRWQGIECNFRHLRVAMAEAHLSQVDGILLDLGLSSDELQDPTKGISFQTDGPLDMRLGPKANDDGLTAAEIVNHWTEAELTKLFREFGEEKFAWRIAKAIVVARKAARIVRTLDLVAVIQSAVPKTYERGRIHPATRTFQALRIAVNDELETLKVAIAEAHQALVPGGRLAIVTFHSLEDRVVKRAFLEKERWTPLTKKPMVPTDEELARNPRSRSAKLRAAIKL